MFVIESQPVVIASALRYELSPLRRRLAAREEFAERGFHFWRARLGESDVLLVQTGVGKAMAADAARFTLERFAPRVLVSTGFAGGTSDSLGPGDLVIADQMLSCSGNPLSTASASSPLACDAKLVQLAAECARKARLAHKVGAVLTVDEVVAKSRSKRGVGGKFGVLAVEMESASVAEACAERATPFVCVRAISDAADQDLHLASFRITASDGHVKPVAAALYFAARPNRIGYALRLRRQVRAAAGNLAAVLAEFVQALSGASESVVSGE